MKTCNKCGAEKPNSDYYRYGKRDGSFGLRTSCKSCERKANKKWQQNNREKTVKVSQKWYWKNKEKTRASARYRKYGITQEDFDYLLKEQNKSCAICKVSFENQTPHVDHDHDTGYVRGLLCSKCNTGIGLLQDCLITLGQAKDYLESSARMAIYSLWEQAVSNSTKDTKPVLFIKANRKEPLVVLSLDNYMELEDCRIALENETLHEKRPV